MAIKQRMQNDNNKNQKIYILASYKYIAWQNSTDVTSQTKLQERPMFKDNY